MPEISTPARDIFLSALDRPTSGERAEFICQACGGDAALHRQVQDLLQAHDQPDSLFDQSRINLQAPHDVGMFSPATIDQTCSCVGTVIGPYKLLEQIGEGGMGLVYMAEQQRPVRRLVALKVVKPGMDSQQVIARFEAERQALAMMDHPNIAKVLDAGTVGSASDLGLGMRPDSSAALTTSRSHSAGRPYFVMELVRGIPISEFCDHKRLTVRERLELMVQVCQAVQHAHQKGIIHRDLKPTNVLVTMNDATPLPKVIDFGIAKALGQQLTEHTLYTGFAQLVGTPLYMSPEQAEMNHLGVDTRSDVYSLGVMLYELLTGSTPFDKETLTKAGFDEMRRIIREQEPLRPSARVSTLEAQALSTVSERRNTDTRRITITLNGELDWIVMKALAKDRSERYESASGLARDIARYLAGDLVQACPPSAAYRFRKFARKNKPTLTTAALLAASLLLGTTVSIWQAIRATAAEAQAVANESKAKAEEQKANALALSEATQRKQAEKNFEAALEAVDQLLANVGDSDLNEIPRVGPLRRKILRDAKEFYERIPLPEHSPPALRHRLAQTWLRIGQLHQDLDEAEAASKAFDTAISLLHDLVVAQPNAINLQDALAAAHSKAGSCYLFTAHDFENAERMYRRESEIYAELARQDSASARRWNAAYARALCNLSRALSPQSKNEEALIHIRRSLELVKQSVVNEGDHAAFLRQLACLRSKDAPAESDDLSRLALQHYRAYVARHDSEVFRERLGLVLFDVANVLSARHPIEAEQLLDECIQIFRALCDPAPRVSKHSRQLMRALQHQKRHLRRLATEQSSSAETSNKNASRLLKAEALSQEAITHQRSHLARSQLPADRKQLAEMLQEEASYVLNQNSATSVAHGETDTTRKLRADALLTEAIQLCRALAAEFPDNSDYKARLADLLKLQDLHFRPQEPSKQ